MFDMTNYEKVLHQELDNAFLMESKYKDPYYISMDPYLLVDRSSSVDQSSETSQISELIGLMFVIKHDRVGLHYYIHVEPLR